jgi:hypothetical protein
MIAFVQPFGQQTPGGGPRILRALLANAPVPFLTVCTSPMPPPPTTIGPEVHLPIRPYFGRIERTRFERYLWHFSPLVVRRFMRQLERLFKENHVKVVHAIPHGIEFWHAFEVARDLGLRYILNVHDDMEGLLLGRPDWTEVSRRLPEVWCGADARAVISQAMGSEYCRRYGERAYSIITDGLLVLPKSPRPRPLNRMRVYFAGLIHHSYRANLSSFLEALSAFRAANPDVDVSFTCRGGLVVPRDARIPIRALPWASEGEVASDLAEADLLYLPLPFESKYQAYRFSLSTKMVTYLGSGLPIVYHGPDETAAGQILREHRAAILINTLDLRSIVLALTAGREHAPKIVSNALELARARFMLKDHAHRFWRLACGEEWALAV